MNEKVFLSSPCIGFCSTTYGDDFCKGCYRHFQSVIQWETLSNEDKNAFYAQISQKAEQVLSQYVKITCEETFKQLLDEYSIEHCTKFSLYYALLRLLQKHSLSLKQDVPGCTLLQEQTWSEFYMKVDKELYQTAMTDQTKEEKAYL